LRMSCAICSSSSMDASLKQFFSMVGPLAV